MDSTLNPSPEVLAFHLKDDEKIPNNPELPLLMYRGALKPEVKDMAGAFEELFNKNGWGGCWRNGVFPFPTITARPMEEEWVQSILRQCEAADVSFFFKQWGGVRKHRTGRHLNNRTYDEMPDRYGPALSVA